MSVYAEFVHHPPDHDGNGPFPPALPVPRCLCGLPAFVKQSRHSLSSGRAFYCCQLRRRPPSPTDGSFDGCKFFQWIDDDSKLDRRIMFFPYDPWKSYPASEFVRWVPPPLDPPEMTNREKLDATLNRIANPPKCKCGKPAVLQKPSKPGLFTPFFKCGQRANDGFPACDFDENDYGPKSYWPSQEEVLEFSVGSKPWPCLRKAWPKCKCGILAREGVVPSELGWGHFCGNTYGGPNELFPGKSCDWEDFPGRGDLVVKLQLRVRSPYLSARKRIVLHGARQKVRFQHGVMGPSMTTWNKLGEDYDRATDGKLKQWHDDEELIRFWRMNKERYDFMEEEERREIAYWFKRNERGKGRLCRNLFPDSPPNDGHLPTPKETDNGDGDDGDNGDDGQLEDLPSEEEYESDPDMLAPYYIYD